MDKDLILTSFNHESILENLYTNHMTVIFTRIPNNDFKRRRFIQYNDIF